MRKPDVFRDYYDLLLSTSSTSRPDFLLPKWDKRAELGSFAGSTKHPGSKPRIGHRHHHLQTEQGKPVAEQAVVLPENQVPPGIEGIEAVDAPLMAAVVFSALANNEFFKKNGPRVISLALALALTTCLPQQFTAEPENPPAVVVVTNTVLPDLGLTRPIKTAMIEASATAILALTPGNGGPEFRPGSAADLQSLVDNQNLTPATCVDVDSIQYAEIRTNLQAQGANIDSLKIALENNLKVGQSLKLLCQQEGWVFVAVDGKGNILWSWVLSRNKWADHMDAVLSSGWEFRPVEARPGYQSEVVILGGQPWLIEFKDGTPARYFDTLTGEFRDFRWGALSGTDRLITQFDWTGINGTRILPDGSLEVSGFTGVDGGLALNRTIQMVDIKGDFSFGAKFTVEAGVGGGLAFMDRDPRGLANWWESRQLHVIVGRESNGQNGLWIGYLDFSQEPETLRFENSIPPQIDGQDVVEIKFRPGTDGITVVINGRELDTVIAKGLLENAKLSLGVSTSQNAKNTVSEFFVNVPVGGQDNVRLQGMLPEATAAPEPASTTAAAPKPRPTAIPATATLEPSATAVPGPTPWTELGLPCDPKWSAIDQQCEVIVYPSNDLPYTPWDDRVNGYLTSVDDALQMLDPNSDFSLKYGPSSLTPFNNP